MGFPQQQVPLRRPPQPTQRGTGCPAPRRSRARPRGDDSAGRPAAPLPVRRCGAPSPTGDSFVSSTVSPTPTRSPLALNPPTHRRRLQPQAPPPPRLPPGAGPPIAGRTARDVVTHASAPASTWRFRGLHFRWAVGWEVWGVLGTGVRTGQALRPWIDRPWRVPAVSLTSKNRAETAIFQLDQPLFFVPFAAQN